jgi:hypothetical protein
MRLFRARESIIKLRSRFLADEEVDRLAHLAVAQALDVGEGEWRKIISKLILDESELNKTLAVWDSPELKQQ